MERSRYKVENPELVADQSREWNKGFRKLIAIVSIGVAAILSTHAYSKNPEEAHVMIEQLYNAAVSRIGSWV